MEKKPKIFVIGTGGTIGAKLINGIWESGKLNQKELISAEKRIEEEFEIEAVDAFHLHSADIQPQNWLSLAQLIFEKIQSNKFDGIVVTHGTDTMSYTATAISYLIQDLNIPIVFTGSQRILFEIGSDAPRNFYDALRVASSDLAEVVIVFNGKILRPNQTEKESAANWDSFHSGGEAQIGTVQFSINYSKEPKRKKNSVPKLFKNLETRVSLVKIHPGFNPSFFEKIAETGVKGIVIEGYGVGNFPVEENSLTQAIEKVTKKNIPVILTSECYMFDNWNEIFFKEIGKRYDSSKVILGFNIRPHAALIKLMWILGQTNDLKKINELFYSDISGEITPLEKN